MDTFHQQLDRDISLTSSDRALLQDMLRAAVDEALQRHHCRLPMTDSQAEEMGHMMSVYERLGEGKASRGIEVLYENHAWMSTLRKRSEKAGSLIFAAVILAVAGGVISLVWQGFRARMG